MPDIGRPQRSSEQIEDIIGDIAGTNLTYDDPNNQLDGPTDKQISGATALRGIPLRHREKPGSGTVTDTLTAVEFREPGNASTKEAAVLDRKVVIDSAVPGAIRVHLANQTIDNSANARLGIWFYESTFPTTSITPGNNYIGVQVAGDGRVQARTGEFGADEISSDSTQGNTFVNALNWVELDWDGSTVTVSASDGTTTVSATNQARVPETILPINRIRALDNNASGAQNSDFDVTRIEVRG